MITRYIGSLSFVVELPSNINEFGVDYFASLGSELWLSVPSMSMGEHVQSIEVGVNGVKIGISLPEATQDAEVQSFVQEIRSLVNSDRHKHATVFVNGVALTKSCAVMICKCDTKLPGAPKTKIMVRNAVPSDEFKQNKSVFADASDPVEITVLYKDGKVSSRGFIVSDNFNEGGDALLGFEFAGTVAQT